ncbi:MAG TPA: helix-turn-helix domain-containing protein [Cyclobacteriaceae bacterium]|nr:helix-turn-helix domain-containing protein [Cyclobacteriaceae bacterium]
MPFYRYEPHEMLRHLVECYWIIEDNNPNPIQQKIVPDGFPEIIFHYGDAYRIKLHDTWKTQAKALLAGQLTKYFFLENTGRSKVLGIKFKPTAIAHLFGISMYELTDNVIELDAGISDQLNPLPGISSEAFKHHEAIEVLNSRLLLLSNYFRPAQTERAIDLVFDTNGSINIHELSKRAGISQRQLERLFKKYVGLSPKFYCRVIRFAYIFKMVEEKKTNWADLGLQAGFYDQPHFIRNFKGFTGEDPSAYLFDQASLANFFMKK